MEERSAALPSTGELDFRSFTPFHRPTRLDVRERLRVMLVAKPTKPRLSTIRSAQHDRSESDVRLIVQSDGFCANSWEAAYLRFQTPAQEMRKFVKRLMKVGAAR